MVVVGAGLSGISQAWHLQRHCSDRSYVILESRAAIGGTWDLFRYPGVRSDSDMHTLGFGFHPWTGEAAIADGGSIREYLRDVARQYGIDRHIRFGTSVLAARWVSETACWTVDGRDASGATMTITCNFLCLCAGYYDYAQGHAPSLKGADHFAGRIVHPQHWPDDLDVRGLRVAVIGSGATAMTLVPALANEGAGVTMIQRSPTYVVARPAVDVWTGRLRRFLPKRLAHRVVRWKNVVMAIASYRLLRRFPDKAKRRLVAMAGAALGPDYDVATHFTPRYAPWDQRLCLVPDGDLFAAIRGGCAEVVTDTIDRVTPHGIALASGRHVAADVIVTATGLKLRPLGGIALSVDGRPVETGAAVQYKGMMFADVPNLSATFGYTNASWTLKADLVSAYVCRLLNAMRRRGMRQATPSPRDAAMPLEPLIDFTSGYVARAAASLPRQGNRRPWKLYQNYLRDLMLLKFGAIDDEMVFSHPSPRTGQ